MKQGFVKVPALVSRRLFSVMQAGVKKEVADDDMSLDYMLGFAHALYLQGVISELEWFVIGESGGEWTLDPDVATVR